MKDLFFLIIIVMIVLSACLYIRKNSKKGIKCIGCPFAASCTSCCSKKK